MKGRLSEPRTETGRRLFPGLNVMQEFAAATLEDVLAIEAEAPELSETRLREAVLAYLDHMEKREPYADIAADIKQAGSGGPDFTGDRHFDGDGCFAEMERAVARDALRVSA